MQISNDPCVLRFWRVTAFNPHGPEAQMFPRLGVAAATYPEGEVVDAHKIDLLQNRKVSDVDTWPPHIPITREG